jgi:hypothetical protein
MHHNFRLVKWYLGIIRLRMLINLDFVSESVQDFVVVFVPVSVVVFAIIVLAAIIVSIVITAITVPSVIIVPAAVNSACKSKIAEIFMLCNNIQLTISSVISRAMVVTFNKISMMDK